MSDMKVDGASGTGYIPAPGAAQVAAVPDNSLNDLLLTVVNWTGAGIIPPGGINLHAPLLDSPGMSPEDQIAILARLDIGVNMERLNLTKSDLRRLLDVQLQGNQQQKETNATIIAKLAEEKQLGNAEMITKWVKAVAAFIGAAIGVALSALATVATFGAAAALNVASGIGAAMALADLIDVAAQQAGAMVKAPDGSMQKLEVSLAGMVKTIVQQQVQDGTISFASEKQKSEYIMGWTITANLIVAGIAIGSAIGGGIRSANAATKIAEEVASGVRTLASTVVSLTASNAKIAGNALSVSAEIAAGVAAIVEGTYRLKTADIHKDTERARADNKMTDSLLAGISLLLQDNQDVFSEMVKAIAASYDRTSDNIASTNAVQRDVIHNNA